MYIAFTGHSVIKRDILFYDIPFFIIIPIAKVIKVRGHYFASYGMFLNHRMGIVVILVIYIEIKFVNSYRASCGLVVGSIFRVICCSCRDRCRSYADSRNFAVSVHRRNGGIARHPYNAVLCAARRDRCLQLFFVVIGRQFQACKIKFYTRNVGLRLNGNGNGRGFVVRRIRRSVGCGHRNGCRADALGNDASVIIYGRYLRIARAPHDACVCFARSNGRMQGALRTAHEQFQTILVDGHACYLGSWIIMINRTSVFS